VEILLDCTELEAPEPLNLVVSELGNVDENSHIKMIHRLKPQMLLQILDSNGFTYEIEEVEHLFHINIRKKVDA